MYHLTCDFAVFAPPQPEMQDLLFALTRDRDAASDFIGVYAQTVPAKKFFAPENLARIIGKEPAPSVR